MKHWKLLYRDPKKKKKQVSLAILYWISSSSIRGKKVYRLERKKRLFTDKMILYLYNPREITPPLPELITDFNEVAGFKVNI